MILVKGEEMALENIQSFEEICKALARVQNIGPIHCDSTVPASTCHRELCRVRRGPERGRRPSREWVQTI